MLQWLKVPGLPRLSVCGSARLYFIDFVT